MTEPTETPAAPDKPEPTALSLALQSLDREERRAFDRRYTSVARFVDDDAIRTPVALRGGLSVRRFAVLSRPERVAVVQAALVESVIARRAITRRSVPALSTPTPTSTTASAPTRTASPRYVVACAGSCGAHLPARGPRAVVAYCDVDSQKRRAAESRARRET